jgi:hypothetical protein
VSAATGKTIAIVLSKNGGAFANPSVGATNATEIAAGWYYVDLSTTDTNTLGPLIVRGTAAGMDDAEPNPFEVVVADPTANQIRDAVLGGDFTAVGSVASHSLINVCRGLGTRNKVLWNSGSGWYDVYDEAGTSVVYHITPSTDPTAQPIIGVTPS